MFGRVASACRTTLCNYGYNFAVFECTADACLHGQTSQICITSPNDRSPSSQDLQGLVWSMNPPEYIYVYM